MLHSRVLTWHNVVYFVLKMESWFSMVNQGLKHIVMKTPIGFLVSDKKAVLFTRCKVFFDDGHILHAICFSMCS